MKQKMKRTILACLLTAPALAVVLSLTSCSSDSPQGQGATFVAAQPGVPGGVIINTYQITATVKAIDTEKRKVTLMGADGKGDVVECGPEVVNFPQIQVGDQVKATITEQLVVAMATDASQVNGAATAVALAPVGAKPGGMVAQTVQITATVVAIDLKHHRATLEFPDGSKKTVAVRPDVDLTQRAVGEQVTIRATESVAISVEKP
jgi:Cu/Ag efflux protein CusF